MQVASPLYLDTSVFIYAFELRDELSLMLRRLISDVRAGRCFLATSQLTYAEAVQKPYADQNEGLIVLYTNWLRHGTQTLKVGPVDADVLYYAAVLRSHYPSIKLPDAIHLSSAFGMGCADMLSNDRRIPGEIELQHTRHGMTRGPLTLRLHRPTVDTVQAILETATS